MVTSRNGRLRAGGVRHRSILDSGNKPDHRSIFPASKPIVENLKGIEKPSGKELLFDYIVPVAHVHSNEFKHRVYTMNTLIGLLPDSVRLVIVEQIVDSTKPTFRENLSGLREQDSYTSVSRPVFNKSWLNNIGARKSQTDNLLFAESDMVIGPDYFKALYDYVAKHRLQWCVGWRRLIYWKEDQINLHKLYENAQIAQGGIVYFDKSFFWDIGAYNEHFTNLGGIDNEIWLRANHKRRAKNFPWTVHHLWHPFSPLKRGVSRQKNKKIYRNVKLDPQKCIRSQKRILHKLGLVSSAASLNKEDHDKD